MDVIKYNTQEQDKRNLSKVKNQENFLQCLQIYQSNFNNNNVVTIKSFEGQLNYELNNYRAGLFKYDPNLLTFWKINAVDYPILSAYSRIILAIPASSTCVERLFSLCRRVLTDFRSGMNSEVFRMLMFIKLNFSHIR